MNRNSTQRAHREQSRADTYAYAAGGARLRSVTCTWRTYGGQWSFECLPTFLRVTQSVFCCCCFLFPLPAFRCLLCRTLALTQSRLPFLFSGFHCLLLCVLIVFPSLIPSSVLSPECYSGVFLWPARALETCALLWSFPLSLSSTATHPRAELLLTTQENAGRKPGCQRRWASQS